MKTKAISSFFVLFAIVAGIVAMAPGAYADHSEVTITPAEVKSFFNAIEPDSLPYFNSEVEIGEIVTYKSQFEELEKRKIQLD